MLAVIAGVFGILGGLCGFVSLIYVYRQDREKKEREIEDDRWAYRFEQLSSKLLRINPMIQVQEPGRPHPTHIYPVMFSDPKLKSAVESFIVELNATGWAYVVRRPRPHEFRSPNMRDTIQKAEAAMDRFIQEHPFCKQHLVG